VNAPPRRDGRRRFLLRVYLHGLVLLLLAGIAIYGMGRLVVTPAIERSFRPFTLWMMSRTAALRTDPGRLQAELHFFKTELRVSVTLYDSAGTLIGSNVDPPLPRVSPAELASLQSEPRTQEGPHDVLVTSFFEGGQFAGYGIATRARPQIPLDRWAAVLAAVLIVIALASIPLARSVVSPVEKLASVARSLGAGDMSARAKLDRNDEIGDLARAFDEMADRVAFLLRSEKELLANVSHELRTPLARIRVVLDLASEVDGDRARRYLAEIAEDLAELERLLDDVLTAARLDLAEGKASGMAPPLRLDLTDVQPLIEKVATRFRQSHPDRTLIVEGCDGLPLVDADEAMLRRVVGNLLDNARKYSDTGSLIRLMAHAGDQYVMIAVADEGIGIEPEDLDNVFTPFFRSDRSRARRTGGVGLGLTLARRIVEAHGGRIELESEVGAGTTVRFTVPLCGEPAPGDS
jgi:two-component system, OmpR family, sensor kinase